MIFIGEANFLSCCHVVMYTNYSLIPSGVICSTLEIFMKKLLSFIKWKTFILFQTTMVPMYNTIAFSFIKSPHSKPGRKMNTFFIHHFENCKSSPGWANIFHFVGT